MHTSDNLAIGRSGIVKLAVVLQFQVFIKEEELGSAHGLVFLRHRLVIIK